MKTETYGGELNEKSSIHGLITFLRKTTNKDNKMHLIMPEQKLKFNLNKDVYKNKTELNLGKVHTKNSFNTPRDNVLNFGILCTKRK